ncbi:MAG: insulinase family protein [Holophagales bacterium]|nr:insulinase family protein [Holophagales bacterium]MYG31879.1 insulinase family protein [Holophagales bacterium]MYI79721.1 insulinase family protein [Holophagales bacterium]
MWIALLGLLAAVLAWPAGGAAQSAPTAAAVPVEEFELDNGMRFLLVSRPELTTVAAAWVAHVGSADERPGITGLAHFFEHMMFKGTHTIGTKDIERDLEIIAEQEAVQEQIRAELREQRRRYRLGEIDDPYDPAHRTDTLNALRAEFQQLVEEQRELMVKDELDKVYTDGGGTSLNAFTSNDFTVYINQLPANRLELWFWLESDRLLNPVFREFYAERDVVYEERRLRTESTPTGRYDEQAEAMFWQSHPYSWPVIGWASDLEVISKSQADEFFGTYYAPNNLSAVLVGNFDSAEVRELAERYFGRLARAERPAPDVVTLEAEQLAEKRMTAECDCQPQLQVRYHAVPFGHGDGYALDVVAGVLNGRTGRLYEQIVEGAELASSAAAFYEARKYAGVFNLRAETKGDATPEQLLAAWDGIVAELIAEPVPEDELAKVKNRVSADTYRQLRDPFFLMIQLAIMDALGDWRYLNTVAERTNEVTAEDVQRVAAKYFEPSKRLVSLYYRKEGTEATETPAELEALPPEMRTALMSQAEAIAQIEDPAQLEMVLQQMEAQSAQVPEEMRPALDWMRGVIEGRLAELQQQADEGGEQ